MSVIFVFLIFEFVWIHSAVADINFLKPRTTTIPAPIVISASQDWDGNDGPWSSFPIQLGTPRQTVKVFVGTGAYQTLVVLPEGCTSQDPSNCGTLRGGEFIVNKSTTWQTNNADLSSNIYPLALETRLGLAGRGFYGFDNITLGWQGSGGPTLINQTIGGIATKDFFLGIFGLTPRPTNFTSFNNPIPSYVENLRTSNLIPSTSWSYTAGNQYRLNDVLGSLVLGGYDASKFIPNDLSWSFNSEDSRDLTVNVYSITMATSSSTTTLLPNTIAAFMDSSVLQIWLPMQACALFEEAFGITWNETLELYLVNDTQHAENVAQNSTLIFQLGSAMATEFVNITLPYAAFDLTLSAPLVSNSTRYFLLKRASNDS